MRLPRIPTPGFREDSKLRPRDNPVNRVNTGVGCRNDSCLFGDVTASLLEGVSKVDSIIEMDDSRYSSRSNAYDCCRGKAPLVYGWFFWKPFSMSFSKPFSMSSSGGVGGPRSRDVNSAGASAKDVSGLVS